MHTCLYSLPLREFLSTPADLNRFTLHIKKRPEEGSKKKKKKRERKQEEEEDEEEEQEEEEKLNHGDEGCLSACPGIDIQQERSYSHEPDKEFKFYLGTLLLLFIVIYVVQAIMLHR